MQRRIFSREYKLEAVKLVRERGVTVAQAARDLDVHENVLRKWVREYGDDLSQSFPGKGQMKPEQVEIERLRREFAKLKAERDILKKAAAYFARDAIWSSRSLQSTVRSGPSRSCFAKTAGQRVAWPCEALGVSRSGFHAWLNRSPSEHACYDEVLLDKITQSFKSSDRTYGARCLWHDVLEEGLSCSLHLASRKTRCAPASFRSGKPIYERAVPAPHGRPRHHLLDAPLWKCLGQRRNGELVLIIENGEKSTEGFIARETTPERLSSITLSASTIRNDAARHWAISAP